VVGQDGRVAQRHSDDTPAGWRAKNDDPPGARPFWIGVAVFGFPAVVPD